MNNFNEVLSTFRKSKGWTMTFISEALEVPYETWKNWESGRNCPPNYTKKLLMAKLERMAKGEM